MFVLVCLDCRSQTWKCADYPPSYSSCVLFVQAKILQREIDLMKELEHPNITRLLHVRTLNRKVHIGEPAYNNIEKGLLQP